MPLATPTLTVTLTTSLIGSGMLGPAVPKLASGVALGLTLWVKQLLVRTIDAGVSGTGTGISSFLIPPQVLLMNLLASYASNGQLGPMAPLEATGLTNGMALGLRTGLIQTTHPSVGTGTGVGRISGPSAYSSLMQGFSSAGLKGQGATRKANAISTALMLTLQVLVLPIPIVGPGGPSPSSGSGSGKIV